MRALVTGAAGFIGSHLCVMLAESDVETFGIDNFDTYYDRATKLKNVQIVRKAHAKFSELDIRDRDALNSFVDVTRPDVIVHLAAKAGVRNSIKFPRQYIETNLLGSQNVFDAALLSDVDRIVMASTSSVYGDCPIIPFPEDFPAVKPLQPYAASKRAAEMLAGTYHHLYGLQTTITRFFTVYGPRGRPDMMPHMLADSIHAGTPVRLFEGDLARDWTYVLDICDGLMRAAHKPLGFEIINLGRGKPEKLNAFIAEMEKVSGGKANLNLTKRPDSEMMLTYADTTRARELLGFEPRFDIEEGVKAMWEWYVREQEELSFIDRRISDQ